MYTQHGPLDVEQLKQKLHLRKNMKDCFRLPMTYDDAMKALKMALEEEVQFRYGTFIFSDDVEDQLSKMAQWLTSEKKKFGMMLCGGVGSGKTTMMKAVQNLLNVMDIRNENDRNAYSTYALKIVNSKFINELYTANRHNFVELSRSIMLGIDDLGIESLEKMEFGNIHTPIVDFLSARYESRFFTIISTNLTPAQIHERYGERTADRFNEMMDRIIFKNQSYRKLY